MPLLQMNARFILALFMSTTVFVYDPTVAIIGLTVFSFAYLILFKLVNCAYNQMAQPYLINEQRFRLLNEGFGGIKDVLLLGRDKNYIKKF